MTRNLFKAQEKSRAQGAIGFGFCFSLVEKQGGVFLRQLRSVAITIALFLSTVILKLFNHKNYNFLACDWFKKVLFSTNSLAKLLSDSLFLDSLLLDSL